MDMAIDAALADTARTIRDGKVVDAWATYAIWCDIALRVRERTISAAEAEYKAALAELQRASQ